MADFLAKTVPTTELVYMIRLNGQECNALYHAFQTAIASPAGLTPYQKELALPVIAMLQEHMIEDDVLPADTPLLIPTDPVTP